jgi:hypothetical protein
VAKCGKEYRYTEPLADAEKKRRKQEGGRSASTLYAVRTPHFECRSALRTNDESPREGRMAT